MTLLTIPQAAEQLGIAQPTLRQLAREGQIPGATKQGRDWLIPEASLPDIPVRAHGRPRKDANDA